MKKKVLLELYKKIYKIRKIEEKISSIYSEWDMRCPVHLSIGQEAVAAGICQNLNRNDKIISGHRCHSHYIAKGGNIKKMIAEIYGKKNGCAEGLGGSMHLQDEKAGIVMSIPIVGSSIPIGAGIALRAKQLEKRKRFITVIFFGEGATEEGIFHETLNFAALNNLPVLFVCENNQYSVYTHLRDRQPNHRKIKTIINGHGLSGYKIDGNDALKVFDISKKVIENIKKTSKPAFIEFNTYRWLEHCGPFWDDSLGYRKKGELKKWMKKCPLKNIKLKTKTIFKEYLIKKIEKKINTEIEQAFLFAKKSKYPTKKDLKKYNYYYQ